MGPCCSYKELTVTSRWLRGAFLVLDWGRTAKLYLHLEIFSKPQISNKNIKSINTDDANTFGALFFICIIYLILNSNPRW